MSDDVLQSLEAEGRARTERVRTLLMSRGKFADLDLFDAGMREIANGVSGAKATWSALTEPQRRVLRLLDATGHRLRLEGRQDWWYEAACGRADAEARVAVKPTVRNLCARGLLAWDGGIVDPERSAVLTERGMFVLRMGAP